MKYLIPFLLAFLSAALPTAGRAQCSWTTYFYDSFEYSTVIPYIIPGQTYQNTPQSWAGCVHAGSLGMYLNIVDGATGLIYDQPFNNLCTTQSYRFSFWTRDTWTGADNLTFQVLDANNNVLSTQNVINGSTWQNITMPAFTPTTTTIHFTITTNVAGGVNGNDAGLDELTLSACTSGAGSDNVGSYCGPGPVIDLNAYLSSTATTGGTWTETTATPSGTFNAATGSWTTSSISPGTYTFQYTTPASGCNMADNATITLTIGNIASVHLGNDTTLCTGQTMTLNAGTHDTYLWNNGAVGPTKFVSNPGGTYWVKVGTLGPNQISNGNFESGNTNFSTQYIIGTGGTWGPLSDPGTYAITTSPNLVHSNFNSCADHTPTPGVNQMVVNGSSVPNTEVWCQTIPVQPNTTYQFGTWATSVESGQNPAQLQFIINNTQIGTVFSPSTQGCSWSQFTQNWTSTAISTAQICIVNQNTNGSGNDFAIDDITFRPICYSYDTIVVQYSAPPVVNLGPDQHLCSGTAVTLDAQNAGSTYLWSTTETSQTITPTTSGTYSVTVTTPQHCSASDNAVITFETLLGAGNDSSTYICSTESQFDLGTLLQSSASAGGTWASLTPAFAGTLSATGMTSLTGQAGTFDFDYVVHGTYCPNDTSLLSLTIHQQPVAAPDQTLHLCNTAGDQSDFSPYLNHPFAPLAGSWSTSANLPAGSFNTTSNVLTLTNLPDDAYTFDFILPAEPGCAQDTTTIALDVTAVPVIQFSSDITEGCQPLPIQFTNESIVQGNVIYTWNLGDGTTSASATTVNNTYEAATCYDITLTALADGLCSASQTITDMICVHAVPDAAFYYGPQQVFSDGPNVSFTNTSVNQDFNHWNFGDGGSSTAQDPEHLFPIGEIGNYEVQLIVTTTFGCTDTAVQIITVKDQLLYYVPNTFTPDGDAFNNTFLPVMTAGFDENDYLLEIYNRWGELVFSTTSIAEGWDGSYAGKIAAQGTYTWKLQFGMPDTDEVKVDVGSVNLIR